jgi:multicomponent Na+:H+ antiporter subunit A
MRRSIVLDTTVRLVFDAALVLSLYLLVAGHNQPGGGFVGGLVAGAACALRFVAGGLGAVDVAVKVRPWTVLSVGLAVAAASAIVPVIAGSAPLDQDAVTVTLPLLGTAKLTSALVFDSGVYLVVVGLVLMLIEGLGDESIPDAVTDDGVTVDGVTDDDAAGSVRGDPGDGT